MNKAIKEKKENHTFNMKPSVKLLLQKISVSKNISMAQVLESIIKEKAKRLGIIEGVK